MMYQVNQRCRCLPKLVLKKFSGDPKTWQEWWDSFKVAVHENGISHVEKFNHLRSLVEGAAYATIAGLSLTEQNYKTAIDLLKEGLLKNRSSSIRIWMLC